MTRHYGKLAVMLAAVAAGSVACSSGGGKPAASGGPPRTAGSAHATGSPSPASGAVVVKADKWLTGPAEKLLRSVNAEAVAMSRALLAGKHGTVVISVGERLSAAAQAALDGPAPPVDTSLYRSGLADIRSAGTNAASGHLGAVGPLLSAGITEITKVTAAADLIPPVGQPPGVGDPS